MAPPTPPTINYSDPRNLRVEEWRLFSEPCQNSVQAARGQSQKPDVPFTPISSECVEERVCIDTTNTLIGFAAVIDGCGARADTRDKDFCAQQATQPRRNQIINCVGERRREALRQLAIAAEVARRQQLILASLVVTPVRDAPVPTFATASVAAFAAVRSGECQENYARENFPARFHMAIPESTRDRLQHVCTLEINHTASLMQDGVTTCLTQQLTPENMYDVHIATQCLITAAQTTVHVMWNTAPFQLEWKKFYASTKAQADLQRSTDPEVMRNLQTELERAEAAGQTDAAAALRRQLDDAIAKAAIPQIDVDREFAEHHARIQAKVQLLGKQNTLPTKGTSE